MPKKRMKDSDFESHMYDHDGTRYLPEDTEIIVWTGEESLIKGIYIINLKTQAYWGRTKQKEVLPYSWGRDHPVSNRWKPIPKEDLAKAIIGGPKYCRETYGHLQS